MLISSRNFHQLSVLVLNCYITTMRLQTYLNNPVHSSTLLHIITLALMLCELLLNGFSLFFRFNAHIWEEFFECALEIDDLNSINNESGQTLFIFNRFSLMVMMQVLIIASSLLDIFEYPSEETMSWIYLHQALFLIYLAVIILIYFKIVLDSIGKSLSNGESNSVTSKNISTLVKMYLKLSKTIDLFNILFGTHLLMMLTISYLDCLSLCNYKHTMRSSANSDQSLVTLIFWFLFIFGFYVLLTYSCDQVQMARGRLLLACDIAEENFSSSSEQAGAIFRENCKQKNQI
ncbi:uncharacterized protein [Euwallacea fornicatus]|uniref:uncharacterized protein n=1 Tax=Euwallacea fornicatus TaxID=995702 RepID=UPI00338F8B68